MAGLFVVRPKPDDLYGFLFFENLVDQAVLDIDPPRAGPDQVPSKLLVGRRRLEGIPLKDFQHFDGFAFKARRRQLFGVLLRLSGVD